MALEPIDTAPRDGSLFTGVWLNQDGSVADKARIRYFEDDDCFTNKNWEVTWFIDPTHWEPKRK